MEMMVKQIENWKLARIVEKGGEEEGEAHRGTRDFLKALDEEQEAEDVDFEDSDDPE